MYGYIYITANIINGKRYIGQHKSSEFDANYLGSGIYLNRAIHKYGKTNFICSLLELCDTKDELDKQEIYWISKFEAVTSKDFYNISSGGTGGDLGYIVNQKRSNTSMGHKVTDATRHKISEAAVGHTVSEETRQKLRDANLGKKVSIETRQKQRDSMLGKNSGENNGAKRADVRAKLRLLNKGKNNPSFGKHWYNNGVVCVLAYECPDGFIYGRLKQYG